MAVSRFRLATPPRVLVPDHPGATPQFVRLAPDGVSLAYAICEAGPKSSVHVVSKDTGSASGGCAVRDGEFRVEDLAWSPTGSRLALLASTGGPPGSHRV